MRDNLSEPLKATSRATAAASSSLEKAKEQTKRYEAIVVNANKNIDISKGTISRLSKEYDKNSKQIEKTKAEIEKYSNVTGLTEKQIETYAKKLEIAKTKLKTLEKAQEDNTAAVETAKKVIVDYEKIITEKGQKLNKVRATMKEYSKTIAQTNKNIEDSKKKLKEWGNSALGTMDLIVKKGLQTAGAITTLVAGFSIKTGFGEAMDMEGYKMQLETATKSTKEASKLMANAIKFANSTPFETGEVISATAKMEAYGMKSTRWLKDIADMAGATNKSIDQATEAMADAVMGEWERLKEFGIKKEQIVEAAALKYGKNIVFNRKGQLKDEKKMAIVLQEFMQSKFKGGAEKQAKTMKGLWSTVTGVTKSSLAKIVGITDQGTVKQGSLYEKLKKQIEKIVVILNKWQEDGTIEKVAEKVTKAVENMIDFFSGLFELIKEHRVLIETILVFVGSIYMAIKAITILKTVLTVLTIAWGILNGTLVLTPLGWVVVAIAGVVTVCYLLWQHLDSVVNMFKSLFAWIKNGLDSIGEFGFIFAGLLGPIGLVTGAILGLIQHFDKVKEVASKAFNFVKDIFGFNDSNVNVDVNETKKEEEIKKIQPMATTTNGIKPVFPEIKMEKPQAYFGENSKYTKDKNTNKNQNMYNITIKGDVYGFEDFKEKVAEAVVKITNPNLSNMVR